MKHKIQRILGCSFWFLLITHCPLNSLWLPPRFYVIWYTLYCIARRSEAEDECSSAATGSQELKHGHMRGENDVCQKSSV